MVEKQVTSFQTWRLELQEVLKTQILKPKVKGMKLAFSEVRNDKLKTATAVFQYLQCPRKSKHFVCIIGFSTCNNPK